VPLGSSLNIDKTQAQAQVLTIPLPQYQVVFFNLNNNILSNQSVRTALSLATDKQQVIDQVFKGNASLPVSPFVFNDPQNPTPIPSTVDLTQARSLLDKAGWTIDPKSGMRQNSKGTTFEITISTNDMLANANAAQLLAQQWGQLNIKVDLSILPSQQLTTSVIKPRAFDVLLFPQKFGADPDPFLFWHSSQIKDPGFNLTGFSNAQADKLIIDARTTTDKSQRTTDYEQFNSLIMSQTPIIFLDQTEYIYALDNEVKNVNINSLYDPSQRFYDIPNWYVSTGRVWK